MSEVKLFSPPSQVWMDCDENGGYVLKPDFDRVTAERDQLQQDLNERDEQLHDLELRRRDEFVEGQATQQRLTAADERADVLEGRASMLHRELKELINDDDGILVAAELSTGFVWHALQKHGKAIQAALKPAEGGGDETI
ncbi:hypothetical protein HZF02_26735 [Pseudomonas yamanorum]|nr:hypothetical protein HZF02_26735 [Pseudomonas yamanorum]